MPLPNHDLGRRPFLRRAAGASLAASAVIAGIEPAAAAREGLARLFDVDRDGTFGVALERRAVGGRPDAVHVFSPHGPTDDYAITLPRLDRRPTVRSVDRLQFDYYEAADNEFAAPDEVWLRIRSSSDAKYLVNHDNEDRPRETWHTYDVIVDGADATDGTWSVLNADFDHVGVSDDLVGDFGGATLLNAGAGKGAPTSEDQHPVSDIYYDRLVVDDGTGAASYRFPVAVWGSGRRRDGT